ncbi:hypothetical protein EON66_00345 [archaeon]|nr:MAG: hypothetical protein EON66_00345 [archaeon]
MMASPFFYFETPPSIHCAFHYRRWNGLHPARLWRLARPAERPCFPTVFIHVMYSRFHALVYKDTWSAAA